MTHELETEPLSDCVEMRPAAPSDAAGIEALYPTAFPDEDLLPLVRDLAAFETISFVGVVDGALVGHAVFTPCGIQGTSTRVALLGPVAVAPDMQGKGLGSTLIRAGLQQLAGAGTVRVYVLGDPAYYGRFGFASDDAVAPPYPLPEEWRGAWQSLRLVDDATPLEGTLTVPEVWRQEALWLP